MPSWRAAGEGTSSPLSSEIGEKGTSGPVTAVECRVSVCVCVYVNMIVDVHRYCTPCIGIETTYWVWNPCVLHCYDPTFHKISCIVACRVWEALKGSHPPATASST